MPKHSTSGVGRQTSGVRLRTLDVGLHILRPRLSSTRLIKDPTQYLKIAGQGPRSDARALTPGVPLLLHTGIVARIDVVDLKWRCAVHLNHRLAHCHRVMMHAGVEVRKAAGREQGHFAHVETIPHADLETSRDHSRVLALGVPMRRETVAVGHFETYGKVPGGAHRVTFEHGQLGSRRQHRRNRTELNLAGAECVLRWRGSSGEDGGTQQDRKKRQLHDFASKRRWNDSIQADRGLPQGSTDSFTGRGGSLGRLWSSYGLWQTDTSCQFAGQFLLFAASRWLAFDTPGGLRNRFRALKLNDYARKSMRVGELADEMRIFSVIE